MNQKPHLDPTLHKHVKWFAQDMESKPSEDCANQTPPLILSLCPGIDLLGVAFEIAGYTVVRGPTKQSWTPGGTGQTPAETATAPGTPNP